MARRRWRSTDSPPTPLTWSSTASPTGNASSQSLPLPKPDRRREDPATDPGHATAGTQGGMFLRNRGPILLRANTDLGRLCLVWRTSAVPRLVGRAYGLAVPRRADEPEV